MKLKQLLNLKKRINWYSAILITFLFLNIGILFGSKYYSVAKIFIISFYIIAGIAAFLIFYLKKPNKVRLFLFSAMAFVFVMSFITTFYNKRGHIGFKIEDVSEGLPLCHIGIINNLLSIPFLKTVVFPAKLTGSNVTFYPMLLIWLWATILIGKGWCSWGCFYGGWDAIFGSVYKKPLIKISNSTAYKLRFIPYAFLIVIIISSLFLFVPVFCSYFCPFKTITEFQQVTTLTSWLLFIISIGSFVSFCILMPIFFGKRIWCTYLCPFGAFQSLLGKIFSIFKIKIDNEKCIGCKVCVNTCKVQGITEETLKKRKFTLNCSLCTECIEKCPKQAIYITAFYNKNSIGSIIEKVTGKLSEIKILKNIRLFIINITDDILNPRSIFYFFALAVLFNFFGTFYFEMIIELKKLFGG